MMPAYIALTALTDRLRMDELACVAAALQTQITRDFASEWGTGAIIAAVPFEAIPAGYCPVIVQDTLDSENASGFHRTQSDEAPYIVLPYGPTWSLTASHLVLQMLANPTGSARHPGSSMLSGQGIVEYVIDVCAPCQDITAAYAIDGIVVSDFCTRRFFGGPAAPGVAASFTGAVRAPFQPAAKGLVTWLADDGLLYQARADETGRSRVHGGFSAANRGSLSMRELIDLLTPHRLDDLSNAVRTAVLVDAQQDNRRVRMANLARYREDIAWRFGHATRPVPRPEPMPRVKVARQLGGGPIVYAGGPIRSGQQRANDEVQTTARTDC
ncbi:MAG: hypothetical protein ACJ8AI_09540 [Rhodopila sp.]|jgi:hypothetical protein